MAVIRQREVELKLVAPGGATLRKIPAALKAMGFRVGPAHRRSVRDLYLDTADFRFYRTRLACRLRIAADAAELSLKALTPATNGLASRVECTEKLRQVPATPVRRLPGTLIAGRVGAPGRRTNVRLLFELRQKREIRDVRSPSGLLLEVSTDTVCFGRSHRRFHEVELELVRGKVRELRRAGIELRRCLPLTPDRISKFERGLKFAGLTLPRPGRVVSGIWRTAMRRDC